MHPGTRPKPTSQRILEGNPSKRPLNTNEPQFSGTPDCPDHLSVAAKAEWNRISVDLSAQGLLTNVDMSALAAYCTCFARWAEAEENIQKYGLVIKSPKSGFPINSPYVGIANVAMTQMLRFGTEFGFTPSSRSRITADTKATSTDPFNDFMNSIGGLDVPDAEDINTNDEQTEHAVLEPRK